MASGSGWTRYIRLTVAGRRLVESRDPERPPVLEPPPKTRTKEIRDTVAAEQAPATRREWSPSGDTPEGTAEASCDPSGPSAAWLQGVQAESGTAEASEPEVAGPPEAAEVSRAKRRAGRRPDPQIARRNRRIVKAFQRGAEVNEVTEKFGISAGLARKIRSKAGLTRGKAPKDGQS